MSKAGYFSVYGECGIAALPLNLQWWWRLIFGALTVQIVDGGFLVAWSDTLSWLGMQSIGRFQASVAGLSHGSGVTLIVCCISSDSYLFAKKTSSPCHTQWFYRDFQCKTDRANGTQLTNLVPICLQINFPCTHLFFGKWEYLCFSIHCSDQLSYSSLVWTACTALSVSPCKFLFGLLFARSFPMPLLCYLLWGAQGAGAAAGFSAGTRSCVQGFPGLLRIYGERRVEQYLW